MRVRSLRLQPIFLFILPLPITSDQIKSRIKEERNTSGARMEAQNGGGWLPHRILSRQRGRRETSSGNQLRSRRAVCRRDSSLLRLRSCLRKMCSRRSRGKKMKGSEHATGQRRGGIETNHVDFPLVDDVLVSSIEEAVALLLSLAPDAASLASHFLFLAHSWRCKLTSGVEERRSSGDKKAWQEGGRNRQERSKQNNRIEK